MTTANERTDRRRKLHAARWGAGTPLDLSPEEARELATARRKARNKRKSRASRGPVQKLHLYSITTALRPLRDKYAHGYPEGHPERERDTVVHRAPRLPNKRRVRVLLAREVTAHDLAKHGMLPDYIRAATQAEAERIAIERRYRAECAKARAAMGAAA